MDPAGTDRQTDGKDTMPHLETDDAVKLYYEESGSGFPVVFVHEFAGDHRSWEAQLRFFSRRYRCIAFNARGYPPSDVPDHVAHYNQERPHQGLDGRFVIPPANANRFGPIECREPLGGLLRFYQREAA